ncbi:MAG: hypothetical protein IPL59_06110 [Candidatus Competibacteraceae bacterium]|nr:hypothetical protein [Candidatus Competibacteraceae bacterium]
MNSWAWIRIGTFGSTLSALATLVSPSGIAHPFAQQAANLWAIKQHLHQQWVIELGAAVDPIYLVDGCPLPLCVLTRASRCRLFAEEAGLRVLRR